MLLTHFSEQVASETVIGELPKALRDILTKARTSWLRNQEVVDLLSRHSQYGIRVSKEPPQKPPGGSLFLFNRKSVRFFRKDGHDWRKKADGKTVRETHEKLKVDNKDVLNCYYAHAEDSLQRRCYWLLEGDDNVVLVHYLSSNPQENCVMRGPLPNGGAISLNAVDVPKAAGQQPSLVSAWQSAGAGSGYPRASCGAEAPGSAGSLGRASSAQAPLAQPRCFVVTTGDVVVRSGSEALEQPEVASQSLSGSASMQQLPTPFARQGSQDVEQNVMPSLPKAAGGTPRQHEGAGAFGRAASVPSAGAGLARSASSQHEDSLRLGPLHTAPSFLGGTVQTGLTMDASELQRARSGAAAAASAPGQLPGDLPPSKLQRRGSGSHASSLEQQRRSMVPAPRLQIKDAQGEERDVLQGLLSLQDAEVALPLDPSGAPCRLSRDTSSTLAGSLARRDPVAALSRALNSPSVVRGTSTKLAGGLGRAPGSSFVRWAQHQSASCAGRGSPLDPGQAHSPAVPAAPAM